MNKTEQVRAWKFLLEQVRNIQDPLLKRATVAEFRERALREWGWDPVTGNLSKPEPLELKAWERDVLERVHIAQQTGVFIHTDDDDATERETCARMRQFIRDGGTLLDIPENVRTPEIIALFNTCLGDVVDELLNEADEVIKKLDQGNESMPKHIGEIMPEVMNQIRQNSENYRNEQKH